MSSAGDRSDTSRASPAPHSAPSQLRINGLCKEVKTERSDGETESIVKKEETLELRISNHDDKLSNTPDVISIKEEEAESKDYLYCELCKFSFFKKCEVHGPALFVPDTPVPMGDSDRARHTLPPGLEIRMSGIPDAGLGVFNKGETVPVGVHYGPYQGELVDREEAMSSGYSWVIYMRQCEEYIDAKTEKHANWMRYVNCARNGQDQNLVAFQYRDGILFRCCQSINPGQELLMWYDEEYARHLGPAFNHLWKKKCFPNEVADALVQIFSCSLCAFDYTSATHLDIHIKSCHSQEYMSLKESGDNIQMPIKGSCSNQLSSLNYKTSDRGMQKKIHPCSYCEKSFARRSALQRHQRIHTGEKPCRCSQCGTSFIDQRNLHLHQRIHTGEKPYHCSQCEKSFTHQGNFLRHRRIHTGEKPYRCSQCGKSFTHQRNLKLHQRIHTGEKPHHCSQCDKSFSQKGHLLRHQHIHTGEKPYRCSQCGKTFPLERNLHRHQSFHTGEKPYHCSQCGKNFTQKGHLLRHQRIHTGEKPYYCSQCGKSFSQQNNFQRHQSIHTGVKAFQCSQCGKCLTDQRNLHLHQRVHSGEKPYHCSQCGKSFTQQSNLQTHQRIHTGEKPYRCSQCGKRFSQQSNFQRHQSIHAVAKPHHCSQCGKSFSNHGTLQLHQCVHTGQKPYHCSHCGKSFIRKGNLQIHQRVHTEEKAVYSPE